MTEPGEDRLREVFELMRVGDAGVVPPFERVWVAAEAQAAPPPRGRISRRLGWSVLLAAAAALALLIARGARQPPALTLSAWRSPTEFLLRPPADPILGGVPRLSASVIEVQLGGGGRVTP